MLCFQEVRRKEAGLREFVKRNFNCQLVGVLSTIHCVMSDDTEQRLPLQQSQEEMFILKTWHSNHPEDISTSGPMNSADAEKTEQQAKKGNPYIKTIIILTRTSNKAMLAVLLVPVRGMALVYAGSLVDQVTRIYTF